MFSGLSSLQRLKLDDNLLQTIEAGAFDSLRSLERLELGKNPLHCDCNLAPFLRFDI